MKCGQQCMESPANRVGANRRSVPLEGERRALRRVWADWRSYLVIVKPETVVAWHRKGFRLF